MSLIYAVCNIPACKYMYNFSNLHYHTAFFLHTQHVYSSAFCINTPITRPFGHHHDIQKVWFFILFYRGGVRGFLPPRSYIAGLRAAIVALHNIVFYVPIMFKRAIPIAQDSRIVDVCVYTIFAGDKPIATLVIEPFYNTLHRLKHRFGTSKLRILYLWCNTNHLKIYVIFVELQKMAYICVVFEPTKKLTL